MTVWEGIAVLVGLARCEVTHANNGACPDGTDLDTRDAECLVCRALDAVLGPDSPL